MKLNIKGVCSLLNAKEGDLTFCSNSTKNPEYTIRKSKASFILVDSSIAHFDIPGKKLMYVKNPKLCFLRMAQHYFPVSKSSGIDKTSRVYPWVKMGKDVVIKEFCVVGSEGLGHIPDETGNLVNFPSYGNVILEDGVELYPFTTVDRGVLDDTIVGSGTKVSHYVYISHNCKVGKNCVITPGVVLCGGVKLGDRVTVGAGALIRNNVVVGDDVVIGMGAVVVCDVPDNAMVYGNPARIKKDV